MRWRKLGQIYLPSTILDAAGSHASNPVAIPLTSQLVRIYFGVRDIQNRTSIVWIEIDIQQPEKIISRSNQPVLTSGEVGCFDDSGCSMGSIVRLGKVWYLYYLGWNLGVTVPWRNAIGLAISDDEGISFSRISTAPIIDRNHLDPLSLSYPYVIVEDEKWLMWYGSQLNWSGGKESMDHVIKAASSKDGINWERNGIIAIPPDQDHRAFSRPTVVRDGAVWRMWYAYRGENYRIGYAESANGRDWQRLDHLAGIDAGPESWDDTMIEYPHVFDVGGERYMLYNGNGFGQTGFGLAILEQE